MWAQRFAAIVVTSSVTFTLCNLFIIKEGLGSVLILTRPTRVSTSAQLGNLLSADGWFVLCYDALIAMSLVCDLLFLMPLRFNIIIVVCRDLLTASGKLWRAVAVE